MVFALGPTIVESVAVGKSVYILTLRVASGGHLPPRFWGYAPVELGSIVLLLFIPVLYYYEHIRHLVISQASILQPSYFYYLGQRKWLLITGISLLVLAAGIETRFVL